MPIIEVNHITKEYRLGALHSFKQSARNTFARLRGETVQERPPFKALDDVGFKAEEGEVLGIIGHNGAIKRIRRGNAETHRRRSHETRPN